MTQIWEEATYRDALYQALGIPDTVRFILRTGYIKDYPAPVSLRRPVDWLVKV